MKKALGSLVLILGILFLLFSVYAMFNPQLASQFVVALFIFILSIIFIIGGILLRRSGNKEIREAKEQFERENQIEANLDKDRRIKELEKRLEKVEDSTKSKDSS